MGIKISRNQLYLIFGFALVAFGSALYLPELRAEEPRRAVVSIEMILSGDRSTPTLNGWPYFNKPPVFNWLMSFFMWLTNSMNEVIVRLPGILSFTGMIFLFYRISRSYLKKINPWVISISIMTIGEFVFLGTVNAGEIDLFYALLINLQVIWLFHFSMEKKWAFLFAGTYFLTAVGFMTKGIPSLVFQGVTLISWLWVTKNRKKIVSVQHLFGIGVFILTMTAFLLYYSLGSSVEEMLVRQLKEASQRSAVEGQFKTLAINFLTYPLKFVLWTLPWSLFLPVLFYKKIRNRIWSEPLLKFAVIFIVFNLPFYWFSGSPKSRYVFMFLPWATLLLISGMSFLIEKKESRFSSLLDRISWWLWMIGPFMLAGMIFLPKIQMPGNHWIKWLSYAAILAGSTILMRKWIKHPVLRVALFILVTRIGFNLFFLPYIDSNSPSLQYKENVTRLLNKNGNHPIHFLGEPYHYRSDLSILGVKLLSAKHETAPLIPYQIPYYIEKNTRQIMMFDTVAKPHTWYLSEKRFVPDHSTVVDSIDDKWLNRKLYLFRNGAGT